MSTRNQPYQMPQPRDIAGLVGTLRGNLDKGRARLADEVLTRLVAALDSGTAISMLIAVDEKQTKMADIDEDDAFGGAGDIISGIVRAVAGRGLTKLTADQKARLERAQNIQRYWIGDNMRFISLKHTEEWTECNDRVLQLDQPMSDNLETPRQAFSALGLDWLIERLLEVHEAYGRVLGFAGLNDDGLQKLAAWERDFSKFLKGLNYHHDDDAEIQKLFFAPYEVALEANRARRRQADEKRAANAAKAAAQSASQTSTATP